MLSLGMLIEAPAEPGLNVLKEIVFMAHHLGLTGDLLASPRLLSTPSPPSLPPKLPHHPPVLTWPSAFAVNFTPISSPDYERWVSEQTKPRFTVTLLSRRLNAQYLSMGKELPPAHPPPRMHFRWTRFAVSEGVVWRVLSAIALRSASRLSSKRSMPDGRI